MARVDQLNLKMRCRLMKPAMRLLAKFYREESGQGLVEYVLLIALVAFAATAGMTALASSINSAFTQVGTILSGYIS
jgi:pilus assembly protein Flp/PilA